MTEIISDIGKIMVFLLLFLSAFLLTSKSTNKLANNLFAAFLIVTAIDFLGLFLGDWFYQHPNLLGFKIASVLLQMPLFFLYVRAICYHNFQLKVLHLVHTIPFFVFLTTFHFAGISEPIDFWYSIFSQVQYYFYILAVFYTLNRYKKLNLENYALNTLTYKWLQTTTILFVVGNSFSVFRNLSEGMFQPGLLAFINLFVILFAFIVCCWFVLKTMRSPQLFTGVDKNLEPVKPSVPFDQEAYSKELNVLSEYMINHQPYLEDGLSLQQLAAQINLPEKHLSFLINRVMGTHFFDYINSYRIQEAQTLLKTEPDLTVQQIMYRVGFSSKSSFYVAFKKNTSQTPSMYRKSIS